MNVARGSWEDDRTAPGPKAQFLMLEAPARFVFQPWRNPKRRAQTALERPEPTSPSALTKHPGGVRLDLSA